VQSHRVTRLKADAREPCAIEVDGEALGRLPMEISVVPQAIRLLVPREAP
jgi:diacylglycerol kinase family enzyme